MNVTIGRVRCWCVGLGVLAALGATAPAALAAPIRTARLQAIRDARVAPWEVYFRRALATHNKRVVVPAAVRPLRLQANGLLPNNSFVAYLRWRRGINPHRFDANHPKISRMLIQDQLIRQTLVPVIPPVVPVVPHTVNPRPQPLEPPRVPEPSSLLVAVGTLAAGILIARRIRSAGTLAAGRGIG